MAVSGSNRTWLIYSAKDVTLVGKMDRMVASGEVGVVANQISNSEVTGD